MMKRRRDDVIDLNGPLTQRPRLENIDQAIARVRQLQQQGQSQLLVQEQLQILDQFHWMEQDYDSKELIQQLLQLMFDCGLEIKCKVIQLLPEIATEEQQQFVMDELMDIVEQDNSLLVPVMGGLRNLGLAVNNKSRALGKILQYVDTVDAEYLPELLDFLLSKCTVESVQPIIKRIRSSLHCNVKQDPRIRGGSSNVSDVEERVFNVLHGACRRSMLVFNAFVKEIQNCKEPLKVIDTWIILMLMSYSGKREKQGELLVKNKLNAKQIQESLLEDAIRGHGNTLRPVKMSLLMLPKVIAGIKQFSEQQIVQLQTKVYVLLFEAFLDEPQDMFEQLGENLIAGSEEENLLAILALENFIQLDAVLVAQNLISIEGIIDNLNRYSDKHLVKFLNLLWNLCYNPQCTQDVLYEQHAGKLKVQLNQLFCQTIGRSNLDQYRVAVVGNLCLYETLTRYPQQEEQQHQLQTQIVENCLGILNSTRKSERKHVLDVLCAYIHQQTTLPVEVLSCLQQYMEGELEEYFVDGLQSQLQEREVIVFKGEEYEEQLWLNLDGDNAPIAIKILPLITSESQTNRNALGWLCQCYGLLCELLQKKDGGEGIAELDAFLGCPLIMCKLDKYKTMSIRTADASTQQVLFHSLCHAINWIRQVVNYWTKGYAQFESVGLTETELKILQRVRQLCLLDSLLQNVFRHCDSGVCIPGGEAPIDLLGDPLYMRQQENPQQQEESQDQENVDPQLEENEQQDEVQLNNENIRNSSSGVTIADTITASNNKKDAVLSETKLHQRWNQQRSKLLELSPTVLSVLNFRYPQDKPWRVLVPFGYILQELGQSLCVAVMNSRTNIGLKRNRKQQSNGMEVIDSFKSQWSAITRLLYFAASVVNWIDKGNDLNSYNMLSDSFQESEPMVCSYQGEIDSKCELEEFECCMQADSVATGANRCVETILSCISYLLQSRGFQEDSNDDFYIDFVACCGNSTDLTDINSAMQSACEGLTNIYNYSLRFQHKFLALKNLKLLVKTLQHKRNKSVSTEYDNQTLQDMQVKTSNLCWNMLQTDFDMDGMIMEQEDQMQVEGEPGSLPSGWRARKTYLQEIIQIYIEWSNNPIRSIYDILVLYISKIPENYTGKNANVVQGIPSLTGALFPTWYRCLFEGLVQLWTTFCRHLLALSKRKVQKDLSQNDIDVYLSNAEQCVKCFVGLVVLTKIHKTQQSVKATTIKLGGKFVKEFGDMLQFWHPLYKGNIAKLKEIIEGTQKATKVLQVLCSEGKVEKDSSLTQKVPDTKKYLELFVFKVKEMLQNNNHAAAFWMGNLKHKNLDGEVVPSQAFLQEQFEDEVQEMEVEVN